MVSSKNGCLVIIETPAPLYDIEYTPSLPHFLSRYHFGRLDTHTSYPNYTPNGCYISCQIGTNRYFSP